MKPDISVVIPLYNKEEHIARAIDSVLGQSYMNFELIIIDDGSTDKSADVAKKYQDERICIIKQENLGVSAARNSGIEQSRAEIIAFLDADDAYKDNFIESIVALNRGHPEAVAFALSYEEVSPLAESNHRIKSPIKDNKIIDLPEFIRIWKNGSQISASSIAVRKDVIIAAGGFPVGVKLGEDIDTWIRLLFIGPIVYDSRPGSVYFLDANNRATKSYPPPERYEFFDTLDKWIISNKVTDEMAEEINEFKNFFRLSHAHYQIRLGRQTAGRKLLLECKTKYFITEKYRLLLLSFAPKRIYDALATQRQAFSRKVSSIYKIFDIV
jgi:glycosyltransferase involved in cell wall biosynthesis